MGPWPKKIPVITALALGSLVLALVVACGLRFPAQGEPTSSNEAGQARPRLPASIPASCTVSSAAYGTHQGFPAFWYVGDGFRAGSPIGVFYEGLNKVQWHGDDGSPTLTGSRVDGTPGAPLLVNPERIGAGMFSTSLQFPAPGCWRVHAELGGGRLDVVIYAFPESLRNP